MGRSFGGRIVDFLWGPVADDVEDVREPAPPPDDPVMDYHEPAMDDDPRTRNAPPRRGRHPGRDEEVVELRPPRRPITQVHYPRSFDDAQALADQFKQGSFLIVDLEQMDERDRARLVNFLCGVAYGRDGKSQRVNDLTFAFAPRHFELEANSPRQTPSEPGYMPRFTPPVS